MTSRTGWLLLGTALGMIALPGCLPWQTRQTGCEGICKTDQPAIEIAWSKDKSAGVPPDMVGARSIEGNPSIPRDPVHPAPNEAVADPVHPVTADPTLPNPEPPNPATPPRSASEPRKLAPLVAALQDILDDRHQDALQHLQAYDQETQEFYLRILPTLTILARKRVDELTAQEVAHLTDQLQSLLATLRPHTELAIDRMCYCQWVKAYGIYQPLPDGHAFIAASGDRPGEVVQLYAEVRNFASAARNGSYETRLASTIEIRDAHGQKVQALDFKDGAKPLRSLTRLNDYYNTYTFLVPALPPGIYQLVLQVADETHPGARRVAQKTLEFRVTPVGTRPN